MKKKILIPILALGLLFTTMSFKGDFFEIAKQIEIFTTLFKELNMNYVDETTPSNLMDKAIKGMLEDLDPYTVYWNEQQVEDARINNSGMYTGIGASVRTKDGRVIIIEPYKDFPADKAGLKPSDELIAINSKTYNEISETEIADTIMDKTNINFYLTILRDGKSEDILLRKSNLFD